ncbi:MAG: sugar kinase [Sphingobium sp.]|uniref:sugar kinase n=1 Tax=Sphingobium sp. TaxID=1912891 RepID=UPI0029AB3248|nr:sugar kinase [Sphingobium sp.]MDX3910757.1 sugar kinase [Sphingobium sp.]
MSNAVTGSVACLGELLMRFSGPKNGRMFDTPSLQAHFGGAEANVAIALAHVGVNSRFISVLPEGMMGDAAVDHLRRHGVALSGIARAPGRLGVYYLSPGAGIRPSSILYDRAGSTFARATAADFAWPRLLDGAQWLHLSGITPALGPDSASLGLAAARAAKELGLSISFDGNYRATLWDQWDSDPRSILRDYVALADLFLGNHRDISLLLGRDFDGKGPDRRRSASMALFDAFPNLSHIASTARTTIDADNYVLSARIDGCEDFYQTGEIALNAVIDRIGTGDTFAAGILSGLGQGLEEAAEQGLALACLKHFTIGDASTASAADVRTFRQGHYDVRR